MHPRRIIFVYGSNHRLFDLVIGWSHKTSTARNVRLPDGNLHGLLTVWDRFMRLLPCATEFVETKAGNEPPRSAASQPPLVLIEHHDVVEVLVHSHDIHETDSVSGLMTLLEIRLEEWRARTLFRTNLFADTIDGRSAAETQRANARAALGVQPNLAELA